MEGIFNRRTYKTIKVGHITSVGFCSEMDRAYCWEKVSNGEYLGKCIGEGSETDLMGGTRPVIRFENNTTIPYTPDDGRSEDRDEKVRRVECRQLDQSMTASSFLPDFMRNPSMSIPSMSIPSMFSSRGQAAAVPEGSPTTLSECMSRIRRLESQLENAQLTIALLEFQRDSGTRPVTQPDRGVTGPPQGGKKQKTRRKKQSRNKY